MCVAVLILFPANRYYTDLILYSISKCGLNIYTPYKGEIMPLKKKNEILATSSGNQKKMYGYVAPQLILACRYYLM